MVRLQLQETLPREVPATQVITLGQELQLADMQVDLVEVWQLHIVTILVSQHFVVIARHRHLMSLKLQGSQRKNVFLMTCHDKRNTKRIEILSLGQLRQHTQYGIYHLLVQTYPVHHLLNELFIRQIFTFQYLINIPYLMNR